MQNSEFTGGRELGNAAREAKRPVTNILARVRSHACLTAAWPAPPSSDRKCQEMVGVRIEVAGKVRRNCYNDDLHLGKKCRALGAKLSQFCILNFAS
jgi:hypothetical protein